MAPQSGTPQGTVPFLHDHVIGDVRSQNHGDNRGDNRGDDVSARGFDEFSELLEMFVGNAARQIREDEADCDDVFGHCYR